MITRGFRIVRAIHRLDPHGEGVSVADIADELGRPERRLRTSLKQLHDEGYLRQSTQHNDRQGADPTCYRVGPEALRMAFELMAKGGR